MGIERIASSLVDDAKKEADEIVKSAEWHLEKMVAEERSKKAPLIKQAEAEIARLLEEKKNERLAWARLEAKRMYAEACDDAIRAVLDEFFTLLEKVRMHSAYPNFLKTILMKGLKEFGEGTPIIHIVKGDGKHLKDFKGKVIEDLKGFGGLLIESEDGKIMVDMRVETLFGEYREELRKHIYENLFEKPAEKKNEKRGSKSDKDG